MLSTDEAAARLGVKPETLYAYVSRGRIRRHRGVDGRSWFDAQDVERLATSNRSSGRPSGSTVTMSTALGQIVEGRLYFRGHDAVALARRNSFETIARFLWTGTLQQQRPWAAEEGLTEAACSAQQAVPEAVELIDRLPLIAAATGLMPGAKSTDSLEATEAGKRLLAVLVDALPVLAEPVGDRLAARLWARLSSETPSAAALRLMDAALGVQAEHGIVRSTLAARVVASSGGGVSAAVQAALGPALVSVRRAPFREVRALLEADDAVHLEHVRIAGSSGAAYPSGDPRSGLILELLGDAFPSGSRHVDALAGRLRNLGAGEPDATFATSAVEWAAGLVPGAAEVIVIVSRTAGWIAHAIEEYRRPTHLHVRERYVGVEPRVERHRRTLDAVLEYLSR